MRISGRESYIQTYPVESFPPLSRNPTFRQDLDIEQCLTQFCDVLKKWLTCWLPFLACHAQSNTSHVTAFPYRLLLQLLGHLVRLRRRGSIGRAACQKPSRQQDVRDCARCVLSTVCIFSDQVPICRKHWTHCQTILAKKEDIY